MLQVGLTYAYEISKNLSFGIAPTFNYAALELAPNPLSSPSMVGYPVADQAAAFGFGAQVGVLFQTDDGFKLGASYKSQQFFSEFDFENTYLDGSAAPNVLFKMNYPSILSAGIGYSTDNFDFALDYRYVDYENTEGFEASGWTQTASVAGFGWENISIISAGLQYKGIKGIPLRVGYTHSGVPIQEDLAFFSTSATAIIKSAFQIGAGFELSDKLNLNITYHHGSSGDPVSGPLLNPLLINETNPLGMVPQSEVSYEMTTDMIMFGVNYTFIK
jgi:long-chain fatty acid transport protein